MANSVTMTKSSILIQRTWRGVLGRRRLASKRLLDSAAKAAFDCVDDNSILVGDIKELGKRIFYSIEVGKFIIVINLQYSK
jgi:hypothetical protein